MWRGPIVTTGVRTQTCTLTMALVVSRKVKVKSSADFFLSAHPLAKPQKIVAKLLLGGSLIDGRAELFSGVALIALVVAKHHSTVKARAGAPGKREGNKERKQQQED